MTYEINGERLMHNLFEMAQIGMNENGGIDRALGSQADFDTREWLKHYWKDNMNLTADVDAIANLRVQIEGKEKLKPIVMGSHHDAVPDGGKYDGSMGVLMATEIMQTIIEQKIALRHPFQVISFTGEEPNPYNLSTLGSKVISGRLTKKDLLKSYNRNTGESLADTISRLGGNIDKLEDARLAKDSMAAFLEGHNELGRHLESEGLAVATVNYITGIYREEINILGEANHAGTTMMQDRKDALLALGELALAIEKIAKEYQDPDVVATVGYAKVSPNEANIIPGEVKALLDIRTCSDEILTDMVRKIDVATKQIETQRNVTIQRKVILDQKCQKMNEQVAQAIIEGMESVGETEKRMVSMAGHDAANMGLLTKAGMIFVQSVGGKGHCRQEYSRPEDIIKAGNALLFALLKLDQELD